MTEFEKTYLAHYGVLGQKWGVRRYQNPDGTLTSEGRYHYSRAEEKYRDALNRKNEYEVERYSTQDSREYYERAIADAYARAGTDFNALMNLDISDLERGRNESRSRESYYNQLIEQCNIDIRDSKWTMDGIVSGYFDDANYIIDD